MVADGAHVLLALHHVASYQEGGRIFGGDADDLKKSVSNLFVKLRKTNQRIRADRVAETLPALLYESSKDLRQVQLISGSNFGLSPWPLFYYGVKNSVLSTQHQNVMGRLFADEKSESTRQCHDNWVGSAPGSNFQTAMDIVRHLELAVSAHERRGQRNGPRSLESWLAYLNALSRKTAYMAGAPAGFRNFDSIGDLTILDFSLRADAHCMLAGEKGPESVHLGYRISSLGTCLVRDQIRVLLTKYQQFLDSRHKTPLALKVKARIRKALIGAEGIFISFDAQQGESVANQAWLKRGLPSPDMPVNFFRHIMASKWVEWGGASRDLYTQIGHAGYADHRFCEVALDSPYLFLKRVEPLVEKIMVAMGWTVTVIDKNLKCPEDRHRSEAIGQRVRFVNQRARVGNGNAHGLRQQEFQDACRELIALKLEEGRPDGRGIGQDFEKECVAELGSHPLP